MLHPSLFNKPFFAAVKPIIAGGLIVSLVGLLIDFNGIKNAP